MVTLNLRLGAEAPCTNPGGCGKGKASDNIHSLTVFTHYLVLDGQAGQAGVRGVSPPEIVCSVLAKLLRLGGEVDEYVQLMSE
jgi:hypothetical protein